MATAGTIVVEMALDDKGMYTVINRVGAALREFQKTTNQTAASVKRLEDANESVSTKFRYLVTTLGNLRFAAMDVYDVFLRLPLAILKSAGEIERTRALLGGLSSELTKTGKAAESAANFSYISKMAQSAPFEIAALSDSFVKLKSAGLDPTKGSMQALVDGVAKFGGTSETLKRASVALQQMLGKGVISMEELRQQLGEAVPTAMRDMATGMGISMADLTKAVSKGTVEAGDAINKMLVVMTLNSEGAAKDMMQTWVGVQAQLKTRMQLAAEEIANAGFGIAMKKVAMETSEALNSIEFQRLTQSAGEGLGAAVITLSNFAKVLIEHADLIKTAAVAWLVYKVASSAIGPAILAVRSGLVKVNAEYAAQKLIQAGNTEAARILTAERIQGLAAESRAQMAASAANIAAMRAELVEKKALKAALLDSYGPAKKAVMSSVGSPADIAAAQQQVSLLRKMDAANSEAMRNIARDIALAQVAHGAAAAATMQHGNAIDTLGQNATRGSGALAALGAAARLGGKVFDALGGWVTVLNVAISAGIYLWMNWGKAAEEAMERSSNARKGLANQKDLEGLMAAEEKLVERRNKAVQALNFAEQGGSGAGTAAGKKAEIEKLKAVVTGLDREMLQFSETRIMAQSSVNKQRSREEAAQYVRDNEEVLSAIRTEAAVKKVALDQAFATEAKAAEGNKKKLAELNTKYGKDTIALALKSARDSAAASQTTINTLSKQLGGVNGDAAKQAITEIAQTLEGSVAKVKMAIDADGPNKIIGSKEDGKKGPLQSKIQAFITGLKEDAAKMDAALPGLMTSAGKLDSASVALAAFRSKFFAEKGKDGAVIPVNQKDFEIAEKMVVSNAKLKDASDDMEATAAQITSTGPDYKNALAFLADPFRADTTGSATNKFDEFVAKLKSSPAKLAELGAEYAAAGQSLNDKLTEFGKQAGAIDLAALYKPVIEKITAMAPDYKQALMVLANPLGANDQTRTNQFDDFLAKIKDTPEALQAAAQKYKVSIDEINRLMAQARDGSRMAATIDLSNSYKSMIDENRKMGLEMVTDDRERVLLQVQAENSLAAARAQARIDEAVARKVDQSEVARMQGAAAENAILRAEKLRLDTRSPMERLADDWGQSLTKMDQASAQWSGNFVDMITNAATTGKLEFGGFVKSILADILKISLQKSLGRPLQDIMSKATDWIKGASGLDGNEKSGGQLAVSEALAKVKENSDLVARSFADMTGMGVAPLTRGLADSVVVEGERALASAAFTSSMGSATSAVYAFVAAMQGSAGASVGSLGGFGVLGGLGSLFSGSDSYFQTGGLLESVAPNFLLPFADGGIMSGMGSVPLRKYAAGGIANSPQMAMFGEGDQNEAYVPLPDGRRIPVAMQGGAPNVTVNVINQSGTPVSASKSQPRFDGKQMILDVVLTAASQPGGFRDGMKGALG